MHGVGGVSTPSPSIVQGSAVYAFHMLKSWSPGHIRKFSETRERVIPNLIFTQNETNMSFKIPWYVNQPILCPFISL